MKSKTYNNNNSSASVSRNVGASPRVLIVRAHEMVAVGFCLSPNEWQFLRRLVAEDSEKAQMPEWSSKIAAKPGRNGAVLPQNRVVFEEPANRSGHCPAQPQPLNGVAKNG
jgi:hypothetical protein